MVSKNRPTEKKQSDLEKTDARVLGQIMAAQNILFVLPTEKGIAEFYAQSLSSIPGVRACCVCLGNSFSEHGPFNHESCRGCENRQGKGDKGATLSKDFGCQLKALPDSYVLTIETINHRFGFFVFFITQTEGFALYQPFIGNLGNFVALSLENRLQKDALQKTRDALEQRVTERTRELESANRNLEEEAARREAAVEALRKSEEKYRVVADFTYDWEIWIGPAGRYLYMSPSCRRITGYSVDDFINDPSLFARIIHPDDRAMVEGHLQETALGNIPEHYMAFRIIARQGEVRWIEHICQSVYGSDGKFLGQRASNRDLTFRKLAEAEVERLKNYLSNIIDSMPSVLVGLDNNKVITQWNRQAETFTGLPSSTAIGRPIMDLLPDFSPWISGMMGEVDRDRPVSIEKVLIEKEGERRFFDLMLYPLITNDMEGAVLRIEDVTERARIQELMIQTEKMMSLGGLAAGMAHEINNPLGIITQAAQNIERRVSPDLPANRKVADDLGLNLEGIKAYFVHRHIPDFINSILEASFRASRIISNMLRFSRSVETRKEVASLSVIVDQALDLAGSDYDLKKKYDFRSIEIIHDYEAVPPVPMVAVEMEQVILNLLKNAAQAMMANPPERKPRITLRLRREDRYILLEIEDNGQGMTEEVRLRVFEPFFTTKDPGIGTGLGLSVSYMIVTQNHKGLMEVDSAPGQGTCFQIRLPR